MLERSSKSRRRGEGKALRQKKRHEKDEGKEIENKKANHCWDRLPRPDTAPPNLPNCLPSPERGLGAGTGGSFSGTGGPRAPSFGTFVSVISGMRGSTEPIWGPSIRSPPGRWSLRALSCTVLNFSRSSVNRMIESSRPLSLFGLSKLVPLGVVAFLHIILSAATLFRHD